MKSMSSTKRCGFTLIELLAVIAIISILTALLFPGVQAVIKKSKRSTASSKLRNIVQAVISFSDGKRYIRTGTWSVASNSSASSIGEYAAVLAYNSNLNTAEIWYVDADKSNENASFPKQVLTGPVGSQQIDVNFNSPSPTNGYHAWTAYTPTLKNLNGDIPLLWTRGLSYLTGVWDEADSVWGSEGGHIGFGDSHIIWTANTTDDGNGQPIFIHRTTGAPSADWKDAVSEGTKAIEWSSK
jgi:prepilin-type N-terminal cleavage/methylation domain-containing protein